MDQHLFSAYESLPTPLIIFSNKEVIYLNKKAAALLELNYGSLKNTDLNVFNYILPEFKSEILKRNEKILKGVSLERYPIKIKSKKGRVLDIDTKSSRVKINDEYYIITVFFEVTNEINYTNHLKISNEVLRLVGNSNTDIIFKYDYGKNEGYSYISESVEEILGYKSERFYKDPNFFTSLIHPEDIKKIAVTKKAFLKQIKKNNQTILRYINKSGETVWLETFLSTIKNKKGEIIGISGISRNITKQKETEKQLQVTEEQLSLIAENALDVIYFFTYQPKPKYFFISNSVEKILGYNPDEFYKDPFLLNKKSIGKTNSFKSDEVVAAKQQKSGKFPVKRIEYAVYHKNGNVVWMEDHATPVFDEHGKISFLFGIIRNIDELKRKENELNQKWSDYKKILDESPLSFFIHDNGTCLLCNKRALKLVNFKSEKQIIGKNLFDFIVPEQHSIGRKRIKQATLGKENDFLLYQMINSKGKRINIEIKTVPITYNGKPCALSVVNDVSEKELFEKNRLKAELTEEHNKSLLKEIELRKKAEEQVASQNLKLSAIFENSSHLFWTVDKNYCLTYFNKNFELTFKQKYGIKPVLGLPSHEVLKGKSKSENKNFWLPIYQKVFKGEKLVLDREDYDNKKLKVFREIFVNPIFGAKGTISEVSCMANDITEKKKSEAKLIEQTARINAIFESGSQIIWTLNADLKYTSFNNNFRSAEISLYGKQPLLERPANNIVNGTKQQRDFWREKYNEVLNNKTASFVLENTDRKGNLIVRQFYLNPIVNESGKVIEISGIGKDITEKALTERKILQQSAKLNALFDGSTHYIWTVDRGNVLTGFNLNYTKLIKDLYNTSPRLGQAINRGKMLSDENFIHSMSKNYERAFNGENVNFELELLNTRGRKIYLDVFLNPVYHQGYVNEISGIAHDITDKRSAIEKLKQSEEKSRAIIRAIPDILFTINREGVFLDVKAEDERMLFFKPDEFIGRNLLEFFPGGLGESFLLKIKDAIKTNKSQNFYYSFEHEGTLRFYEARYRNINQSECLVLIRDITIDKQNQEKLTQSLKEKEVLLKEVHHRVKNNMQIISSILNLQSSYTNDPLILNLLRESQNRIKTMAYIHESLYQNKTFSFVNFNEYLSQLISNIVHSYSVSPEKIKLLINCNKVVLNLDVSIPLGLIINELVTNAIKHAFPSTSKGIISVDLKTENNLVTLTVQDNGIGIDTEFNPESSNSLGLQLVHTLIDQIDGKISFELLKPHGTIVNISFVI